jgi:hypothetical protein
MRSIYKGLPIFQGGKDDDPPAQAADDTPPEGSEEEMVPISKLQEVRTEAKNRRLELRKEQEKTEELTEKLKNYDKMKATLKKMTGGEPDDNGDMEAAIKAHEAEMAATKAQTKNAYLRAAFMAEAAKNNIKDPDLIFAMINSGDDRLSFDLNTGEVDGIDEIVTDLIKKAPYLVKAADGEPTPAPAVDTPNIPAPGSQPPNAQTRPPDKAAELKAALEKAKETGGVKAVQEYFAEKRRIEAEG